MTSDIIYQIYFLNNKYTRTYFSILENRRKLGMPNCYSESHHIIPKSIGGKDKRTNKTYVSAREHFILHWLLTKMCVNT